MKNLIPSWVRVPVIFFSIFGLAEYVIDSGEKPAFIENPLVLMFLVLVLLVLIGIEGIVSSLDNILYQSLDEEGKARYLESKSKPSKLVAWIKNLYKKLAGGKPIEEEHEIILDHNYDGIKELDNSLPPWWLYAFYASIVFAVIYLFRYHVLYTAPNQFAELDNEYTIAQKEIEEYKKTAKDLVDFETVQILTEAADLANGKKIFEVNCVACHKADGGGGIGPNLTDEHWILGGGIKNVFHTITEGGRDGKGMIAWKTSLKPSEINQVASYVLTFQGTTPAEPKAPEGDIWVDESTPEAEDTTEIETPSETNEVVTDSVTVALN